MEPERKVKRKGDGTNVGGGERQARSRDEMLEISHGTHDGSKRCHEKYGPERP